MALQNAFILNANEIFASIANMIISQEVMADTVGKHQTLVDKARVNGGLYGDRKIYIFTDVLKTNPWGVVSGETKTSKAGLAIEAANLLALDYPEDPEAQAIDISIFRQIRLSTDNYLSKRAWSTVDAFSSFNSVMLGWMRTTKSVYDGTTYNVAIGTTVTTTGAQNQTVTLSGTNDGQVLAEKVANLLVEMGDYSRDFNDLGNMTSFAPESLKVIWNSKYVNKVRKLDTPTIYHAQGLVDKLDEDVLPARYFGTQLTEDNYADFSASTPAAGKPIDSDDGTYVPGTAHANGIVRAVDECDVTVSGTTTHCFPGDELPAGAKVYDSSKAAGAKVVIACYIENAKAICKIVYKLPPYMSAFEVGSSWYNPRSLTENTYLTFSRNKIDYLKGYPFVTLSQA